MAAISFVCYFDKKGYGLKTGSAFSFTLSSPYSQFNAYVEHIYVNPQTKQYQVGIVHFYSLENIFFESIIYKNKCG